MPELLALGLSHKTAPVELRERLALPEGRAAGLMGELTGLDAAREATVLSTCNRTEVYLVADDPVEAESAVLSALSRQAAIPPTELVGHLYSLRGLDVAEHLFDVTAGLDSMIVGEAEIQGQVKRAHELALAESVSGPILNRLFRGGLGAGGRVRSETGIGRKGVSIASVAVDLAGRALGDLANRKTLVVGAGATAELVARALVDRGADAVFIANRHYGRARELATRFGGDAVRLDRLEEQIAAADIVISATNSPHHLVDREILESALAERAGRPIFLIDLAVPRDIDPDVRSIPGVSLVDVDEFEVIVNRNLDSREVEAQGARRIIRAELTRFSEWLEALEVKPVIVGLRAHADEVARRVLAENEGRWQSMSEADRQRLELFAGTIVTRLLHEPIVRLKERAGQEGSVALLAAVRELFQLDPKLDPSEEQAGTVTPIRREAG